MDKKVKTIGLKEGLGAGVISLGLIFLFLPSMIQKIADLEFIESSAFAMLSGAVMVLAIFTVIAGLVTMFSKIEEE